MSALRKDSWMDLEIFATCRGDRICWKVLSNFFTARDEMDWHGMEPVDCFGRPFLATRAANLVVGFINWYKLM